MILIFLELSERVTADINIYFTKKQMRNVCNNNLIENKKSSKKRKMEGKIEEIIDENYLSHDDSSMMEDDVDKDPDWKKTPLYNRIQKLQVIL